MSSEKVTLSRRPGEPLLSVAPEAGPRAVPAPGQAEGRVLNLGCGRKRVSGAVNLDLTHETSPDVIHDLDRRPWPFPDDRFDKVLAHDVIEHLAETVATLEEIHRVCRHGALVRITVPHYSSPNAFTDPTHRHHFGRFSFGCMTEEHDLSFYTRARFVERSCRIIFHPTALNKFVWRLANRYPAEYERRWAWMFPAWFLSVELEVVKAGAGAG
jgi:SAM-dependent methyltransferase